MEHHLSLLAGAVSLTVPHPDERVRVGKAGRSTQGRRDQPTEGVLWLYAPHSSNSGVLSPLPASGCLPTRSWLFCEWMASSWAHRGGRAGHVQSPGNECGHGGPSGAAHPSRPGSGSLTHLSTVNIAAGQATSPELHCRLLCPGGKQDWA